MASLTGSTIASSYTSLLKLSGNTDTLVAGNDSNAIQVVDGNGDASPLYLNTDRLGIGGQPRKTFEIVGSGAEAELIYLTSTQSANTSNRVRQSHRLLSDSQERTSFSLLSGFNTITDGSRNSIVEFKTSNAGTFGTAMSIDGGNVGIGTTTPSSFDSEANNLVVGDGSGDNGITIFTGSSAGNYGSIFFGDATGTPKQGQIRYEQNNEVMSFHTNTAERMRIDLNGNIGVGTDSPGTAKLKVLSATDGAYAAQIENSDADNGFGLLIKSGDDDNVRTITARDKDDTDLFLLHSAGKAYFKGNVGIGTTSPTHAKMEIIGDADAFQLTMSDVADSDDTVKEVRMGMLHYKQAEEPVTLFYAQSGSSSNAIYIGGGTGVGNAATSVGIVTGGNYNTASGSTRMLIDDNSRISLSNNDGDANNTTIFGYLAGNSQTSGSDQNCYFGHESGKANVYGDDNVCVGFQSGLALGASSGSVQNSLVGSLSGTAITDGDYNTFLGYRTGYTGTNDISTGTFNTFIGKGVAGDSATATNQTAIGADVTAQGDNTVTLGNASVTDVYISQDSGAYVHSQNVPNHVANTMSSPYYKFDGTDDAISVGDASSTMGKIYSASVFFYIEDAIVADTVGGNGALFTGSGSDDDMLWIGSLTGNPINQEIILVGSSSNLTYYQASSLSAGHHHIAISWDGTQYDIYLDGTQLTTTNAGTPALLDSDDLIIGNGDNDSDGYGQFNGQIHSISLWNKSLTTTEVKELYSGASVPFKYKGANQTSTTTGNDSTFDGAGNWSDLGTMTDTVGSGVYTLTGNGGEDYIYLASKFTIGKAYRVTLTLQRTGGSDVTINVGSNINGTATSGDTLGNYFSITTTSSAVTYSGEFIANNTDFRIGNLSGFSGTTITLDNITSVPIGAVAEFDGSTGGEKVWGDKSGNDLHGTVSGATLENTPYDSGTEYEEGTWTPVVKSGSNVISVGGGTVSATYVKIGRQVTVKLAIEGSSTSGTTGSSAFIEGLPYACGSTEQRFVGSMFYGYGLNLNLAGLTVISQATSRVFFKSIPDSADYAQCTFDATSGTTYAGFAITYFTD